MRIRDHDKDYQVKDYSMKRAGGEIVLKWKYSRGSHFFVLLYDGRKEVDLQKLAQEMEDKGLDDRTLLQKGGHHIYTTSDEKAKLFLFREREFVQNGESCTIPGGEIKHAIPYGVSVFIGEYDKEEWIMHLYQVKDPEINTKFVPVKLEPKIEYKNKLFAKEKLCVLHVPYLQDYMDGALQYHVDGVRMTYPLPASCLDKNLYIEIPKDASVVLRVADQYKKDYRVEAAQ